MKAIEKEQEELNKKQQLIQMQKRAAALELENLKANLPLTVPPKNNSDVNISKAQVSSDSSNSISTESDTYKSVVQQALERAKAAKAAEAAKEAEAAEVKDFEQKANALH